MLQGFTFVSMRGNFVNPKSLCVIWNEVGEKTWTAMCIARRRRKFSVGACAAVYVAVFVCVCVCLKEEVCVFVEHRAAEILL